MVHNVISTLKTGVIYSSTSHKTTWYSILHDHYMHLHCYTYNEYDSSWLYFKYPIQSAIQVYYFIISPYTNIIYEQIIVFKCRQIRMSVTFSHKNYKFQYSSTTVTYKLQPLDTATTWLLKHNVSQNLSFCLQINVYEIKLISMNSVQLTNGRTCWNISCPKP
jgi:hypothetical protein